MIIPGTFILGLIFGGVFVFFVMDAQIKRKDKNKKK